MNEALNNLLQVPFGWACLALMVVGAIAVGMVVGRVAGKLAYLLI